MRSPTRALRLAVPAVLAIIVVEAVVSIAAGWPHQFGGHGVPNQTLEEFPANGTALAPPLFLVLLLVLIAVAVQAKGVWGTVGTALLVPVAAIMVVGAAGELVAAPTPDVPSAVRVFGGVLDTLLSLVLLVLAVSALVERWRQASADGPATGATQTRH